MRSCRVPENPMRVTVNASKNVIVSKLLVIIDSMARGEDMMGNCCVASTREFATTRKGVLGASLYAQEPREIEKSG